MHNDPWLGCLVYDPGVDPAVDSAALVQPVSQSRTRIIHIGRHRIAKHITNILQRRHILVPILRAVYIVVVIVIDAIIVAAVVVVGTADGLADRLAVTRHTYVYVYVYRILFIWFIIVLKLAQHNTTQHNSIASDLTHKIY